MSNRDPQRDIPPPEDEREQKPGTGDQEEPERGFLKAIMGEVMIFWTALLVFLIGAAVILYFVFMR